MNEREIEERLRTAIEKTAPNDFSGVLSRISDEKGSPIMTKKKNHRKFISGAIAACLALAILGGGGTYYSKAYAVSSIVSLDVNPSIELRVNSREKILACNPLNDEAIAILADMDDGKDLKGVDLGVAVNALIGALVRNGYLDSVSSSILISVEDKNEERAAKLRREVTETVDSVLTANSSGASVLSQTLNKDTNLDSIAKNNNISTGKAALVSQVHSLNESLDLTELAALSVDELKDLIEVGAPGMPIGKNAAMSTALKDAGITADQARVEVDSDIDEIPAHYDVDIDYNGVEYEYKIDAYTSAIIEKKTEDRNGSVHEPIVVTPTPEKATEIGLESAKAIALKHAGVSAEKAVFTKSEIDHDDGVIEYEFEFIVGNIEYECKVNASGAVIKFETETIDRGDDYHKETVTTTDIGVEAAKSTVFKHAGVDAAKVYELEVERDIDDGRLEYEIEFKCGNMEYEYKIDGATGAILEHEADYDD